MSEISSVFTASSSFYANLNEENLRELLNGKKMPEDSPKLAVAYLKRFMVANPKIAEEACELLWKLSVNGLKNN